MYGKKKTLKIFLSMYTFIVYKKGFFIIIHNNNKVHKGCQIA